MSNVDMFMCYLCLVTYVHYICAGDCYDWWNSREAGQNCGKVAVIGQNCKVAQNSRGLVEFALIVAIATSRIPGGTG